jgi:hypothetical protein
MSRHHRLNLKVNVKNKSTPARTRKAPFTRAFYGAFLACNEQIFLQTFSGTFSGAIVTFLISKNAVQNANIKAPKS